MFIDNRQRPYILRTSFERFIALPFQGNTGYMNLNPNTYDIYATLPLAKTVVAGPFTVIGDFGDIVHLALIDTADPNVLQFVEYDHVNDLP